MTRRELREQVFCMLFGAEFHNAEEMPRQIAIYEQNAEEIDEKEGEYLAKKCQDIVSHIEEIDAKINEVATGWKTSRMGKADLTLLRLAVYEMKYEEDTPVKVAINEAVELAKKYGAENSPSFINGVLAKLA
ncbi:MAG: transcription antitermination factor NusB [Clostridiales bacterium]|nr:transcription antitermination factor NusB [Clostridiales bacterium]